MLGYYSIRKSETDNRDAMRDGREEVGMLSSKLSALQCNGVVLLENKHRLLKICILNSRAITKIFWKEQFIYICKLYHRYNDRW